MRINQSIVGCLLFLVALSAGRAEIELADLQDRKATVEIVAASPTDITAVIQGRKSVIKLDQLSEASRTAAIDYAKSKGVFDSFPPIKVQVKIGYQHRNNEVSWYKKDVTLKTSAIIEGLRKMQIIPGAEATMVIITHDTEEKYVNHVDKLKVYAAETIPIPEGSGGRREFSFEPVKMTFDTARDPSNVGGNEYRYFIFGLRDPVTKQLVDFQTNSVKVEAYVAQHPEVRDTLLAARKGAPFTDELAAK